MDVNQFEKIQLVNNHAQIVSQLEEKLRNEIETKKELEEQIKFLKRKHREKEERLTKQLQIAEEGLVSFHFIQLINCNLFL
jgi:glutamate racemase